jgi:hypothetical protein
MNVEVKNPSKFFGLPASGGFDILLFCGLPACGGFAVSPG